MTSEQLPEPFAVHELWGQNVNVYTADQMHAFRAAGVAQAIEACAKLCETWMEAAERESGPEAAGWLHQVAQTIRATLPRTTAPQK